MLLPAFFAVAGLSVDLGMLDSTGVGELAVVLAAAVGAKIASAVVAGRLAGLDTRTAAALAALLNTRGLTDSSSSTSASPPGSSPPASAACWSRWHW
ncbi:cation:proton antiporter domain-containing protein [Nocardia thailandica]